MRTNEVEKDLPTAGTSELAPAVNGRCARRARGRRLGGHPREVRGARTKAASGWR